MELALVPHRLADAAARHRLSVMFAANADAVWRVLRRCGLEPALADDGLQQVFVVAQQRLADIQPDREVAFLMRVALRVGARLNESSRREELGDALPEVADSLPGADELVERRRSLALLDRLLARLPGELREVLVLAELEGLTKRETAEALQIPEGTAASRLRRAREALSRELQRLHGPPHQLEARLRPLSQAL